MTEPIAGLGSTSIGAATGRGLGALDGDAFLRLMIAQLKYQSPFEPMDTSQMLQQTAQLTTVESLQSLASTQRMLMGMQQASMAASLVGRHVTATVPGEGRVTGVVTGIGFTADGPVLRIADREVPIGSVTEMTTQGNDGTSPSAPQG